MQYNQKREKKASKRVQLCIFMPHFSKFRASRMLQSPEQHVFWEFLVQNKVFYLSKRHKQVAKLSSAGIGYSALHGVNPNSKKKMSDNAIMLCPKKETIITKVNINSITQNYLFWKIVCPLFSDKKWCKSSKLTVFRNTFSSNADFVSLLSVKSSMKALKMPVSVITWN